MVRQHPDVQVHLHEEHRELKQEFEQAKERLEKELEYRSKKNQVLVVERVDEVERKVYTNYYRPEELNIKQLYKYQQGDYDWIDASEIQD